MAGNPAIGPAGDPTNGPVAQLSGVTHRYGHRLALDAIDLQVAPGEMLGIIGPDGVGKSTLLSLMAGVRRLQDGTVHVLGGDLSISRVRRAVCARIAYMPQGLGQNLYPNLSVRENLDFFARLFGAGGDEREHRIKELLDATGLAPFPDRAVVKLSGGMKQKLGLCAALIHDPDIIILDEPTTGVDPLSRRQFWELIARIRARRPQMSVVVATAYMEEAEAFDRLVAMDEGRILALGSPGELMRQTGTDGLAEAFVKLLPESKRGDGGIFTIPPRTATGGPAAIEANGLTRRFGSFTAVDNVSFHIERGEIFGFVGSNGCGKTTTMKIMTGLLAPTAGEARLFGQVVNPRDMKTRQRVGYMSQAFSLYGELTVQQNLDLHARLFHVAPAEREDRVTEMIGRFGLAGVVDELPASLPLGMRQRLSLAIAVIHRPEVLILDEPTSGVDPVARDEFWRYLAELSRQDGVTIFISTHFMNEAERCDRVSLMHAGRVLAVGTPEELAATRDTESLEEAFIAYLREQEDDPPEQQAVSGLAAQPATAGPPRRYSLFSPRRLWAYARREMMEVLRDPIRLAFAFLGPMLLMFAFSYGISFDVENLDFAALDRDRTPESRELIATFSGSRYFEAHDALTDAADATRRLRSGEILLAIEIPPGFAKDLLRDAQPEIGIRFDGSMPFRAETARGYATGVIEDFIADQSIARTGTAGTSLPFEIEPRFRYNQAFRSVYAMAPGAIMLLMIMIPAMMTAVGVVREKELGSITNLYATPTTRLEFLLGKQAPYIVLAMAAFCLLVLMAAGLFAVPVKGSLPALALGGLIYVTATTGFGLLISSFVRTQIAAIFATAILSVISSINFSGLFLPVSSLEGMPRVMALTFPAHYFHQISIGTIAKGLGVPELWHNYLVLGLFAVSFLLMSALALNRQER